MSCGMRAWNWAREIWSTVPVGSENGYNFHITKCGFTAQNIVFKIVNRWSDHHITQCVVCIQLILQIKILPYIYRQGNSKPTSEIPIYNYMFTFLFRASITILLVKALMFSGDIITNMVMYITLNNYIQKSITNLWINKEDEIIICVVVNKIDFIKNCTIFVTAIHYLYFL